MRSRLKPEATFLRYHHRVVVPPLYGGVLRPSWALLPEPGRRVNNAAVIFYSAAMAAVLPRAEAASALLMHATSLAARSKPGPASRKAAFK